MKERKVLLLCLMDDGEESVATLFSEREAALFSEEEAAAVWWRKA
ncbi:hypothetical protein SLEP1_g16131 [Rubroshorea leprosula]|uniref:Uncharacterized protein n=1 Tax=Rubroshorea leprosula TaxID=152421 RepID=A0AAV5ITX4_9ROSI|nr:hypothetical protein SLEP1_g16131 [Rubroshorea leprosula]